MLYLEFGLIDGSCQKYIFCLVLINHPYNQQKPQRRRLRHIWSSLLSLGEINKSEITNNHAKVGNQCRERMFTGHLEIPFLGKKTKKQPTTRVR
jgi:hypothetical protein